MTKVREHFEINDPFPPSNNFICGCEFEIESIRDHSNVSVDSRFSIVNDHSLRNNGYEYKTRPLGFDETIEAFKFLHKNLVIAKKEEQFSERTSIHIHVNCLDMELSTVRQLVLTYALLEPIFFNFIGDERKNNIFCVPLNYTYLPEHYAKDITFLHAKWHKYTAFNIQPLGENKDGPGLGTIEYRHLYGTRDLDIFAKWLRVLYEFHSFFARNPNYDLLVELKLGTLPSMIAQQIVPSLCDNLYPTFMNSLMKNTLLDVKLAAGGLLK